MENLKGKWALVTGASSGFGMEFAKLLAERNANIVLVARRAGPMARLAEHLKERYFVNAVVEGMDLSQPGACAELKCHLDRQSVTVDVLVNNAGFGLYGDFVSQPRPRIIEMLQLNMLAVTELTHILAADMVKRRSGYILLVSSLLGYQATPGYTAYAASKAYVLLFGEALHAELKPHGVGVTVLSPGVASTSFGEVARQNNTFILRTLMMEPSRVARAGISAMLGRRASVIAGSLNKLVAFSNRFTPRQMQCLVMQKVMSG